MSADLDISSLDDDSLFLLLQEAGIQAGPIVPTTRPLYEKMFTRTLSQQTSAWALSEPGISQTSSQQSEQTAESGVRQRTRVLEDQVDRGEEEEELVSDKSVMREGEARSRIGKVFSFLSYIFFLFLKLILILLVVLAVYIVVTIDTSGEIPTEQNIEGVVQEDPNYIPA